MIVFLLRDGSTSRVNEGVEVVHEPCSLVCLDAQGMQLVSLEVSQVAGYTLTKGTPIPYGGC